MLALPSAFSLEAMVGAPEAEIGAVCAGATECATVSRFPPEL